LASGLACIGGDYRKEKHRPFIPHLLRLTFLGCIACGGWEVAGLETSNSFQADGGGIHTGGGGWGMRIVQYVGLQVEQSMT
jgi:hypothetical protein